LYHAKRPQSRKSRIAPLAASRSLTIIVYFRWLSASAKPQAAVVSSRKHRQTVIVQLQDREVDRGGVNRSDAPAALASPAAIGALHPDHAFEKRAAILAPGQPLVL